MSLTLRRIALVVVAALTAWAWPTTVASAHTGTGRSVTSDFRTRITSVSPQVAGLRVRVPGLDGSIEATWTGRGTLVVLGYEGEPYLRLDADGIERNVNSPATYLNGDRYARRPVPPTASATAAPHWERIGSGHTIAWHDHRTHYMSPGRPREVAAGADRPVVITPRWDLTVVADGTPVSVTGDLFWIPPPNTAGWLLAAAGAAILLGLLLTLRQWRWIAAGAAALASALLVVDSIGYLRAWPWKFSSTIWLVAWPALAVAATAWMAVAARRPDRPPSPSIAVGGVVLAAMGGYDRLDVIRHALVDSAMPDWFTRVTAVTCLAVGVALLVRFLVWLLPAALVPPAQAG